MSDRDTVHGHVKGKPFTGADADRLAREAEAGMLEARPGRPKLGSPLGRGKSPTVNFRVDPRTAKKLESLASREGVAKSEIARRALEQYLDAS